MELDRAQDTLSIKGVTRPMTYTVQDISLELQIFPEFDGDVVRFKTAKPGEAGASKIALQLGSISDRQIRETTKKPPSRDDVAIDLIEDIDEDTRKTLKKVGVTSARDLEQMEKRNVDLERVSNKGLDYSHLAKIINQSRRRKHAPTISRAHVAQAMGDQVVLALEGANLMLTNGTETYPLAMLNDEPVPVVAATDRTLQVRVSKAQLQGPSNELKVALDPYALFRLEINP